MNKNLVYIGIAVLAGLGLGYLFFGNSQTAKVQATTHEHSEEADQMWTCSMHPQIMQAEAGDCPICGMDLIKAEAGADGLSPEQFKMTKNALALANIETMIIGDALINTEKAISLSGKIAANQEATAVQASYFDGRIERLNVNYEGQEIRKGQLVATIYSPELVAAQQELLTASSLKETQPQLYHAVRNKLKLWKLSDDQINGIESSGKAKENFPVYATVSGTVSEVLSSEGDYLKKGQPIAKVSNLNTVWAEFDAYESQLSQFKKGQKISIATNAYSNKTFDGKISFIDPILNNTTRTVTVRATLNNKDHLFKPGMFVTGKLLVDQNVEGASNLTVPATSVMWTGKRSLVYVKVSKDEPIFEMREVMLGARTGKFIEVTHGLSPGEEVVTNGTFTVDAAAQLQGKKSMMNKTGGKTMTGHEGHQGMQEGTDSGTSDEMMHMEFSEAFQKQFERGLLSYFKLKDALVASDAKQTAEFAKATLEVLNELDNSDLGAMEKTHLNKSIEMLRVIAEKEDLEYQRAHFVILNENMVPIATNSGKMEGLHYVQQCPMANNNKGAVWLSNEKEIRNPYYGDAMLTCGSIIEQL